MLDKNRNHNKFTYFVAKAIEERGNRYAIWHVRTVGSAAKNRNSQFFRRALGVDLTSSASGGWAATYEEEEKKLNEEQFSRIQAIFCSSLACPSGDFSSPMDVTFFVVSWT